MFGSRQRRRQVHLHPIDRIAVPAADLLRPRVCPGRAFVDIGGLSQVDIRPAHSSPRDFYGNARSKAASRSRSSASTI